VCACGCAHVCGTARHNVICLLTTQIWTSFGNGCPKARRCTFAASSPRAMISTVRLESCGCNPSHTSAPHLASTDTATLTLRITHNKTNNDPAGFPPIPGGPEGTGGNISI
jgi:hypothetical protein